MNNVSLVGRLTKQVELRYSPNGTPVSTFTIAVNRMKKDEADFINCVCFKKTAENMANFTDKGSQVAVTGSIQTRNYEKDGRKVYVTEIIANQVTFLDSKKSGGQAPKQEAPKTVEDPFGGEPFDIESELPF